MFGICRSIRLTFRERVADCMIKALRDEFMQNDTFVPALYLGPTRGELDFENDETDWDSIRATLCAFFATWGRRDREFFFNGVSA